MCRLVRMHARVRAHERTCAGSYSCACEYKCASVCAFTGVQVRMCRGLNVCLRLLRSCIIAQFHVRAHVCERAHEECEHAQVCERAQVCEHIGARLCICAQMPFAYVRWGVCMCARMP